ncbi:MAG: methionyl-tRNA formyltransferase [Denitrovibrio sp.]|nr:MAG: methionyl-tRNA formyltransferase [Denitrovibrio sp.]
MKVVFMGTPEMAVPTLRELIENDIEVTLVITQTDKPKGRGKQMQAPPVKEFALEHGIEVVQPKSLKNNDEILEQLKAAEPDFLVVAAFGKILPQAVLDVPKFAPVNVHFSLLPKYRGAAPVNWAVINGEKETGVATMLMDAGLDTGDILLVEKTPIEKKTALDIAEELSETGAKLLIKTLKEFDSITPIKQKESDMTYAPMMKKEDGKIDWIKSAVTIECMIRGFVPWPTAYTSLGGKTVKLFKVEIVKAPEDLDAGMVFDITKKSFSIKCGNGGLKVLELQPEGKKRMPVASFLAGTKLTGDERFE